MKKTKIVATIGPASEKKTALKEMLKLGMNVCRLNFSHGDHQWHKKTIKKIREIEKEGRKKIGIIADIQGPRVRVASKKDVTLKEGDAVFLTDEKSPKNRQYKKEVILDWNGFYEHLQTGKKVFIEDGLIQLETIRRLPTGNVAKVLVPGVVKNHKGVNIPSISHHMGFLTEKDLFDLEFILSQSVDFIAVSFVADEEDLRNLRRIIDHIFETKMPTKEKKVPWIISKVEREDAIKNIDGVIHGSDGIMIARGDLAIETPQEKVTIHQKNIINKCRKVKKPVIVATQMMASMTNLARPTRAEVSDVTNAVIDNADAVMLSNESAVGKYPKRVIGTMSRIIRSTEESPYNDIDLKRRSKVGKELAKQKRKRKKKGIKVKKLETAINYSALRQEDVPIKLETRDTEEKRKATLVWGVY